MALSLRIRPSRCRYTLCIRGGTWARRGGACSVPATHTLPVQASSLLTSQGKVPLSTARCPGQPLPASKEPACVMPMDSSAFSASWWQYAIKMQRLQNRLIFNQTTGHLDAEAKPFQAQGLDGEFGA